MITVTVYHVHQLISRVLPMWRWVQIAIQWVIFLLSVACSHLWKKAFGPAYSQHSICSNKTSSSNHTQFEIDPEYRRKSAVIPYSDTEMLHLQAQASSEETVASDVRVITGPSIYIEQACGEPQGQQLVVDFSGQVEDRERGAESEIQMYNTADSSIEGESTEITSESEVEVRGQGDCRKPRGRGAFGRGPLNADNETESSEPESSSLGTDTTNSFASPDTPKPHSRCGRRATYVTGESAIEIPTQIHNYCSETFKSGSGNKVLDSPSIKDATSSSFIGQELYREPLTWKPHKYRARACVPGESQLEVTTGVHTYASECLKIGVVNNVEFTVGQAIIEESNCLNKKDKSCGFSLKVPASTSMPKSQNLKLQLPASTSMTKSSFESIILPKTWKEHECRSWESQVEVTTGVHTYDSDTGGVHT